LETNVPPVLGKARKSHRFLAEKMKNFGGKKNENNGENTCNGYAGNAYAKRLQ
jgi:hypothetical protein